MKKYLILLAFLVGFVAFFAGKNDRTRPTQAATVFNTDKDVSYLTFGGGVGDTIVVSDTVSIPIVINHSAVVKPEIQLYWDKISAGTAHATLTFWQSNDGTTYTAIKKGKLQTAYSKTLSIASDTTNFYSFAADSAIVEGRYLKLKYITTSTASVKGKLTHKIKFNL